MPAVVSTLLDDPSWDGIVLLAGGPEAEPLTFTHPSGRVISLVKRKTVREVAALTQYVNMVVGPETGLMNAAACYPTKKILLLSHSSATNIAKYWLNTTSLTPSTTTAPCYGRNGCHQLHYSFNSCPILEAYDPETKQVLGQYPACSVAISPQNIIDAIKGTATTVAA